MSTIAIGIGSRRSSGQAIHHVVGIALGVLRRRERAIGHRAVAGRGPGRSRPGQPIEVIIAEFLVVRARLQSGCHRRHIAGIVISARRVEARLVACGSTDAALRYIAWHSYRCGVSITITVIYSIQPIKARSEEDRE